MRKKLNSCNEDCRSKLLSTSRYVSLLRIHDISCNDQTKAGVYDELIQASEVLVLNWQVKRLMRITSLNVLKCRNAKQSEVSQKNIIVFTSCNLLLLGTLKDAVVKGCRMIGRGEYANLVSTHTAAWNIIFCSISI